MPKPATLGYEAVSSVYGDLVPSRVGHGRIECIEGMMRNVDSWNGVVALTRRKGSVR